MLREKVWRFRSERSRALSVGPDGPLDLQLTNRLVVRGPPWVQILAPERALDVHAHADIRSHYGGVPTGPVVPDGIRLLGVNLVANAAYLVLLETPDKPRVDDIERLKPAAHLDGAEEARDFYDRFVQELRRIRAQGVAVAYTRQHAGWSYRQAFAWVSLETCIMLATTERQIPYYSVGPEAAAKAVGLPIDSLQEAIAPRFGVAPGRYWKQRCLALAAAVGAAKGAVR